MNRFWLPCLISVAVHAAVLVPLLYVPTPASMLPGQPLALEAFVLEEDVQLSLIPPDHVVAITLTAPAPPPAAAPPAPIVTLDPPAVENVVPASTNRSATASESLRPVAYQAPGSVGGNVGRGSAFGATTSFFAVPARARTIVYVIDRSLSMGPSGALGAVKRELLASLERLPVDTRFQIVFYNRTAEPLVIAGSNGLIAATPANKDLVRRQMEMLAAEGGTDHVPAFARALALEPDVMYFLTDADDLCPEQVRQMTQLNHGRAVVHTIELSTANANRPDMPLHVLARDNRGTYQAARINP